jgi:hypothetical protein
MGHTIRTDIIPNAVMWFTGEAIDEDYEDDGEEGKDWMVGC